MGASVSRLVFLLSRDFVKLVIIANVIAWPLAFYLMNRWLQDFVYRINIRPWIFVLSSILSLTGALFVAGWKTLKAARMNPADILRRE
jgi:putative ABC transport system permease protein